MAKTINTRIQNKHDIEANWNKATGFIPLAGEIIVYDPDENYDYPRFKIGDGTTNVINLPFATKDLPVDTNLDANSSNAIANSAVVAALDGKLDKPVVQSNHLSEQTGTAAATFTVTNLSKDITVITDGPAYAYYSFTLTSNTGESAIIFPTGGSLWWASEATTLTFNIQSIANETGTYIPGGDSYTFSIEDDGTPSDTTVIYTYGESSSDPMPMTWEEMHEMKANKIRGSIEITYNEDGYFQIPEAAVTNGIKIKTDPSIPDSESLYVLNVYEKVYQDTWTYQQCNELTFDSGVFIVPRGGEEVVLDNFVGSSYWNTNYYYQWSRAYYNSITMSVDGAKDLPEVYDELNALKAKVAELESTINTLMNGEW